MQFIINNLLPVTAEHIYSTHFVNYTCNETKLADCVH